MVFASMAVEGVKGTANCPYLTPENKKELDDYLSQFRFD
jgi:hypothetical protein